MRGIGGVRTATRAIRGTPARRPIQVRGRRSPPLRIAVTVAAVVAAFTVAASPAVAAQGCEITGTVPQAIRAAICGVATSVHGGGAPVNALTLGRGRQGPG